MARKAKRTSLTVNAAIKRSKQGIGEVASASQTASAKPVFYSICELAGGEAETPLQPVKHRLTLNDWVD